MTPDEARKLLGGYATGTLTPEEQQALFAAALTDQELFDALMKEQALKEVLDDRSMRAELLTSLEAAGRGGWWAWLKRPWIVPAAAAAVLATATVGVMVQVERQHEAKKPVAVTEVRPASPSPAPRPPAPPQRESTPQVAETQTRPSPARPKPMAKRREPTPAIAGGAPPQALAESKPAPVRTAPASPPAKGSPVAPERTSTAIVEATPPPPPVRAPEVAPPPVEPRAFAPAAPAQAIPGDRARQLFYGPSAPILAGRFGALAAPRRAGKTSTRATPGTAQQAPVAFGLRYSLRRTAPGEPASPADANTVFSPGESAEFVVEANANSHFYLFRRTPAGEWAAITPGGLDLAARVTAAVPPIAFAREAPEAELLLVLSREPLPEFSRTGTQLTAAVNEVRSAYDTAGLLAQTADESEYLVDSQPNARRIVTSITLK
jgi:hypothetical protein